MTAVVAENEQLESTLTELDLARVELEKVRKEITDKKFEFSSLPARELSSDEKVIVDKHLNMSVEKKAALAKLEEQKKRDNEMITGRFLNLRCQGQTIKLPYDKHPGDVAKWHTFEDGKVYTIKKGFADQINGGDEKNPCYYKPKFVQREGPMNPDAPQSQVQDVDCSFKKYAFVPIGY